MQKLLIECQYGSKGSCLTSSCQWITDRSMPSIQMEEAGVSRAGYARESNIPRINSLPSVAIFARGTPRTVAISRTRTSSLPLLQGAIGFLMSWTMILLRGPNIELPQLRDSALLAFKLGSLRSRKQKLFRWSITCRQYHRWLLHPF